MADQKSRGGQKKAAERQSQGKQNRDVRVGEHGRKRDMAEDAARGEQSRAGGFNKRASRRKS